MGAALLAGCSAPVEVGVPDEADSPACAQIRWPQTVAGQGRVITSPREGWVAAWGDPAIITRCGLPALEPTALDCVDVDGIDWIVREFPDGMGMSTYGTDPALEVLVPDAYGPGPLVLPAFSEIARSLPRTGQQCTSPGG